VKHDLAVIVVVAGLSLPGGQTLHHGGRGGHGRSDPYTDFTAKLVDVYPDGTARMLHDAEHPSQIVLPIVPK